MNEMVKKEQNIKNEKLMNPNNLIKTWWENYYPLPVQEDKTPLKNDRWKKYQKEKVNFEILENAPSVAVCTGVNGLEFIDIEGDWEDAGLFVKRIQEKFDTSGIVITKTKNNGRHIIYRCNKPERSQHLAKRLKNDKEKVFIETRGNNAYAVIPPSPGYSIISGDPEKIRHLSNTERENLLSLCRAENEVTKNMFSVQDNKNKVGKMFNDDPRSIEISMDLLKDHGWKTTDNLHFTRPEKTEGVSATFGKVGKNLFYVFSSNAGPFEMNKTYKPFAILTLLQFNGDFKKCASILGENYKSNTENKKTSNINAYDALEKIIKSLNLKFSFNVLTRVLECAQKGKPVDYIGLKVAEIAQILETEFNIKRSHKNVIEKLLAPKLSSSVNPIKEFINSLPEYNGKNNFEDLMAYIDIPSEEDAKFVTSMIKKHFIRTIRCAVEGDYINRMVLVFHGPQEIGKSKFIKWFSPEYLYTSDNIDLNQKDSHLMLCQNLIINMDELDALNKTELSKLKSFISKDSIKKRLVYGQSAENFNRTASIFASTNKDEILVDMQNTRWIFLKVKNFQWRKYTSIINPQDLWAEAIFEYKNDKDSGELTSDENTKRNERNSNNFLVCSTEREILHEYFEYSDQDMMTTTEIQHEINIILPSIPINVMQLRQELRRMFGHSKKTTKNGVSGRYFPVQQKQNTQTTNENEKREPYSRKTNPNNFMT